MAFKVIENDHLQQRCDRCRSTVDYVARHDFPSEWAVLDLSRNGDPGSGKVRDLCASCATDLDFWLVTPGGPIIVDSLTDEVEPVAPNLAEPVRDWITAALRDPDRALTYRLTGSTSHHDIPRLIEDCGADLALSTRLVADVYKAEKDYFWNLWLEALERFADGLDDQGGDGGAS